MMQHMEENLGDCLQLCTYAVKAQGTFWRYVKLFRQKAIASLLLLIGF